MLMKEFLKGRRHSLARIIWRGYGMDSLKRVHRFLSLMIFFHWGWLLFNWGLDDNRSNAIENLLIDSMIKLLMRILD